jgi:hypothetical protein
VSRAWAAAVSLGLVLGCGGSSGPASGGATALGAHGCSNVMGSCISMGNAITSCDEYAGYTANGESTFKSHCNGASQTWAAVPCDRTGSVGGCAIVFNGTCSVEWSYPPLNASDIQGSCSTAAGTFVTP